MKRVERTAIDWAVPIEQEYCVPLDLTDAQHWEAQQQGEGQFVAAQEVNTIHFYRALPNMPESIPVTDRHGLKFVAFVGLDRREGYLQALEPLRGIYSDHSPTSLNASELLDSIAAGVDALLLIAHGDSSHGVVFRSDERGSLRLEELEKALLSNSRPLRFAYFMLCDLKQPLLEMLGRLAEAGKLHPQFGGIVMWGSPTKHTGEVFTGAFLKHLLETPDAQHPFLKAVQAGRLAVLEEANPQEAALPIAVAFHPHANPLPNKLGQAIEEYLSELVTTEQVKAF